ncbi:MAG: SpoIID/LytB domain-containing protein, partial [Actinomycetota bacterium]
IEAGAWGRRWVDAVEATAGEALMYAGEPASTFYFSTSNGRTYSNSEVWGSDPLPYLPSVKEQDDGESPLSRWSVTVPFDDLARFLGLAGLWPGGSIQTVDQSGGRVVIEGGGSNVSLTKSELRSALNAEAPCRAPSRYPTSEPDGYRLPLTVPSIWYRARQDGRGLLMTGRGWGHGIGMVQWGAKGKADLGMSYEEILGFYYGGLTPQPIDVPGTIRILVASGLRTVTVDPSGAAEIRSIGGTHPPWRVHVPRPAWRLTGGKRLRLRHGPQPPRLLEVFASFPRDLAETGERFPALIDLPTSVKVRFEFLHGGTVVGSTPWHAYTADARRIGAVVPPLDEGRYAVRIAASNGIDTVTTRRKPITVEGSPGVPEPSPTPVSPRAFRPGVNATGQPVRWLILAGLLGATAASGLGIAWRRHRNRIRSH